jgi:hypothetical protein
MVSPIMRREGPEGLYARRKLRWWHEVAYAAAFYAVYSFIRNQLGSAGRFDVSADRAIDNAVFIIDLERNIGLFIEESVQATFLDWDWFIRFWNIFYGSLHFVVTAGVMVFLFCRFPARYRRYRNVLAITTGLALVGFALFPLMPPRLLDAGAPFGAHLGQFDFVDTLASVGGLWSFDSGAMVKLSNQWAAMPSLHIAWASWCLLAVWPVLRHWWSRALFLIYPWATLFGIVVTANHYWLDAIGGLTVLLAGWWLGNRLTNRMVPQRILERTERIKARSEEVREPPAEPARVVTAAL